MVTGISWGADLCFRNDLNGAPAWVHGARVVIVGSVLPGLNYVSHHTEILGGGLKDSTPPPPLKFPHRSPHPRPMHPWEAEGGGGGAMCVCVCVCALYFDEVDPCAALGWTPHSAQVC